LCHNQTNPFTNKGINGSCGVIINQVQKNRLIGMSASDRELSGYYIERLPARTVLIQPLWYNPYSGDRACYLKLYTHAISTIRLNT
jgi:hypothetical protein